MTRIIDAHQHFWRTGEQELPWLQQSHAALVRDFQPEDLELELRGAGVDATVLMQSVDEPEENLRLVAYASSPRVAGVVAWLPLQDPEGARRQLDALHIDKLVGVRCLISTDPLSWLAEPAEVKLFGDLADRGLAWDVVPITQQQTEAVIGLARAVPDLRIVIDHLGRPPLESGQWEPWATLLGRLSTCENVAVKVSVGIDALTAWSEWGATTLEKYVRFVAEQFGAKRLMIASNWPVVLLRASYATAWGDLKELLYRVFEDEGDRSAVFGGTAESWYRLAALDHPPREVIADLPK